MALFKHFQATSQPFAELNSADVVWPEERVKQGLTRLRHQAGHTMVVLVTGGSDVGKSALLKRILHELSRPQVAPPAHPRGGSADGQTAETAS